MIVACAECFDVLEWDLDFHPEMTQTPLLVLSLNHRPAHGVYPELMIVGAGEGWPWMYRWMPA